MNWARQRQVTSQDAIILGQPLHLQFKFVQYPGDDTNVLASSGADADANVAHFKNRLCLPSAPTGPPSCLSACALHLFLLRPGDLPSHSILHASDSPQPAPPLPSTRPL
jgi:hypothetical protein